MNIINTSWERIAAAPFHIGRSGTNDVTAVCIDVRSPLARYPGAAFAVRLENPRGVTYDAAQVDMTDGRLTWTVTEADTAEAGEGRIQIIMYGPDGEIDKSARGRTIIRHSLGTGGTPPDPVRSWLDAAQQTVQRAEAAAEQYEDLAGDVKAMETSKADKTYMVELFEQLKALILAGDTTGAIALLDQAILDQAVLA